MSTAMSTFWEQRNPRERQLLGVGAAVLAAAVLWFIAISPALQTYRVSATAHAKVDAELANMLGMAAEATKLKAMPRANAAEVQTWLDSATKKLGKASFAMQGGRVQVSFTGATPEALAAYLAEARLKAQLVPSEAHWKKNANLLWDGSIVFELAK